MFSWPLCLQGLVVLDFQGRTRRYAWQPRFHTPSPDLTAVPPGAMVRMSPNEAILMHHFLSISDVQLSTMFTDGGLLRSGFTLIRNRWPSGETS